MKELETFPHHFHEGARHNVRPFKPKETMKDTLRVILEYVRQRVQRI